MSIKSDNLDYTLFSWSAQGGLNPIEAVSADGVYVTDSEGKKYLDFSSQLMNMNLGHGNETVLNAIRDQLGTLQFVFPGMATQARGDLGKKLAQLAPGSLTKTFFTNGGADAIENAIKMARAVTGRHKIVTKFRSYHGATYGAITAGGDPRRHPVDRDCLPGVVHVEDPYCYRCPWSQKPQSCKLECAAHVERVIGFENPQNVAAVIMEGESGSSGCIKYPPGYLQRMREFTAKHGILLIIDEVMSGFGRCGQWFAIENAKVEPDMIVIAKGLTAGYVPMGGVIVSESVANFFESTPLPCGLTYSGHAIAAAAGLGAIKAYEDGNLIEAAREKGAYIDKKVSELAEQHPCIGDFRNTGLLGCIELVKNRDSREPIVEWNTPPSDWGVMKEVMGIFRAEGLFTFVRWNFIFIAPPLTITFEEIDRGIEIISKGLERVDLSL